MLEGEDLFSHIIYRMMQLNGFRSTFFLSLKIFEVGSMMFIEHSIRSQLRNFVEKPHQKPSFTSELY